MTPNSFQARRLFGWLPAAVFLAFSVLLLIGAPNPAARLFSAAMLLVTALWLIRCPRVGVETTDEAATVRTSIWTHRYERGDIVEAQVVPMPTMSPLRARWPYVALGLRLRDGRTRRFSDISAASSQESFISAIVDHINRWRDGE